MYTLFCLMCDTLGEQDLDCALTFQLVGCVRACHLRGGVVSVADLKQGTDRNMCAILGGLNVY